MQVFKPSFSKITIKTWVFLNYYQTAQSTLVPLHLEALFKYRIVWYYAQLIRKGPEILLSTPLYWVRVLCSGWIHKVLRFPEYVHFWPKILLCRTQTACFTKSKCSLSHMLLTPDTAWLGTWQVGRGVVSILKWVGTAFQLDCTNRDHPFKTSANFYDFWHLSFFTTVRRQIWKNFDPSTPIEFQRLKNGWSHMKIQYDSLNLIKYSTYPIL